MPVVLVSARFPLDCARQNCKMLNPLRADRWCRACLVDEVQRRQEQEAADGWRGYIFPDYNLQRP